MSGRPVAKFCCSNQSRRGINFLFENYKVSQQVSRLEEGSSLLSMLFSPRVPYAPVAYRNGLPRQSALTTSVPLVTPPST